MRILVISSTPWAYNNSFGNTFSNFFEGIRGVSFCNIYCKPGLPDNELKMECYQISEKNLVKSIVMRNTKTGKVVDKEEKDIAQYEEELIGYGTSKKLRFQVLFWARNLIWRIGKWKTEDLIRFVDGFRPDVIFQPIYYYPYLSKIALFFFHHLNVPMVGYVSDDIYTLKKVNLSPLYWVDRILNRKNVRRIINKCDILYVISEIQKNEYERLFSPTCKILTKSADFSKPAPQYQIEYRKNLQMVYAGNLGGGRIGAIKLLIAAIKEINKTGLELVFDIYSSSPISKHSFRVMEGSGVTLHEAIPYKELLRIQKDADILVHVEGLSLKAQMEVHQSFSTKLVDYFALGKCIFAIGTYYQASIKHLIDNDAAVVATNKKEIEGKLEWILNNREQMQVYGKKAYECGRKHHDSKKTKRMLCDDLSRYGTINYS